MNQLELKLKKLQLDLAEVRRNKRMTQDDLALATGTTRKKIISFEEGVLDLDTLNKIINHFNVNIKIKYSV